MRNELLLLLELVLVYGGVLAAWRFGGKTGLYVATVFVAVLANIEVLFAVEAFGMTQTLGNVLFAATFLITDILSEMAGKRAANTAVCIGIFSSAAFLLLSLLWRFYLPIAGAGTLLQEALAGAPRVLFAGLVVFGVVQLLDVALYHTIWKYTARKCGSSVRFLWLRNNAATLLSQLCNTLLFTFAAFWGVYDSATLWQIVASTYLIYVATSLLDTPFVYLARRFTTEETEDRKKEGA